MDKIAFMHTGNPKLCQIRVDSIEVIHISTSIRLELQIEEMTFMYIKVADLGFKNNLSSFLVVGVLKLEQQIVES
jgi:hypothetical protein